MAYPEASAGNLFGAELHIFTITTMVKMLMTDTESNSAKILNILVSDASKRLYLEDASADFSIPKKENVHSI